MPVLKPFVINATDIQFLSDQVHFRPLFKANSDIIVAWDGTGTVYDFFGNVIGTGGTTAGDAQSIAAIAAFGSSYQNYTDLSGTRDVSGFWNNLAPLLSHYGDTGFIFPRMAEANYDNYLLQITGDPTTGPVVTISQTETVSDPGTATVIFDSGVTSIYFGPGFSKTVRDVISTGTATDTVTDTTASTQVVDGHHLVRTETITTVDTTVTTSTYSYTKEETTTALTTAYGTNSSTSTVVVPTSPLTTTTNSTSGAPTVTYSGGELDGAYHGFTTDYALHHQSYAVTGATGAEGDTHASDGTAINIQNVVDYTPRTITRTTTTAGVEYDTWANHQGDPAAANHTPNEIYYGPTGEATVLNWGQLETVAKGGLGQVDTQARLAASAGQNDHFIGGLNPGVSPSNGFFVLFGQFFDHGLDFIDKGQTDANGKNVTIKIALAVDDPLYGMLGQDGKPVTEITINRATVQTIDANGSEYTNHISPFIDQSQTYGSDVQRTLLLRQWVADPADGHFHAGMKLFDGTTLATAWTKPDGTTTNDTLPTLNELRAHIVATGRDNLTWEDISNLRNRDGAGHVVAGTSGEALLLDMNPRFDAAHLYSSTGFNDTNHDGLLDNGELTQHQVVDNAIATLNADVQATYGTSVSLAMVGGVLTLTGLPGAGGPLTGASALFPWVDFSNFSIMQSHPFAAPADAISAAAHDAVSEILMASVGDHYIAGDGRANENFGLTSIHHVFHEEHNFQVDNLIDALHRQDIATNDVTHAKLHEFQIDAGHGMNAAGDYVDAAGNVSWDQEKVFQGAKLIVEMEYQHAAVDQYARNVSPNIQEFVGYSPDKNPDVTLEYSQVAFRFGHSTLRETIDTIDPEHGITGKIMGYALHDAFLNPEMYGAVGPASILLGMTHQQMNEVDEFVTPALNQGLLGQPLDLAAINIARGRDIGMPTLNDFREAIGLARYTSWNDFGQNMQHPSSLVNFIAAYSFDGDVAKASAIVGLVDGSILEGSDAALGFTLSAAYSFINGGDTGFNQIDTWLGGLAEIHQPGGLLGETFDLVFVTQIESLMDGDRFYYLYRLAGQQFGEEVANAQLKDIVERNTGLSHLNGNVFGYADQYIDLGGQKEVSDGVHEVLTTGNEHKYGDVYESDVYDSSGNKIASGAFVEHGALYGNTMGVYSNGGLGNANDGHVITIDGVDFIQDTRLAETDPNSAYGQNDFANLDGTPNSGAESSEVIVGTDRNDLIYAQGGDDTVYGEEGNDTIYGGYGIDRLYGGGGSDHMYGGDNPDLMDGGSGDDWLYGESSGSDINGADQIIGGSGNDHIYGGTGIDKLSAGSGDDEIFGGQDTDPFTHGGDGNDYVDGGSGGDILYGDNGDDIVVGGADQDQLFGDDGDDILRPGDPTGALTIGGDEVLGGDGTDVNDKGFDLIDFSDNTVRPGGVTFDLSNQQNPATTPNGSSVQVQSFQVDGVVGSAGDDTLIGDDATAAGAGSAASIAGNNWLIGGSGNDMMTGGGGNDIIVGGSIRLDALVGKYNTTYDHNMDNAGLTEAEQLLDARYQGASHRVAYDDTIDSTGLLGHAQTSMFDKHFTEMLRTEMFKDTVLGDGDGAAAGQGGDSSLADTAIYTGNVNLDNPALSDYTVVALDVHGNVVANPHVDGFYALKITDNRTAADFIDANGNPLVDANGNPLINEGTDLLVGVENLQFANQTIKVGAFFDNAPALDLHSQLTTTSFSATDTFAGNGGAYSRGAGWSGGWTESNDQYNNGGGRTADNTGQIHYSAAGGDGTGGTLQINGGVSGNGTSSDGASISRAVNLSGYTTAHVSFRVSESGLGNNENVRVYLTDNGNPPAPNAVPVYTIDQNTNAAGNVEFDVTGNFSANSRLYFVTSAMNANTDIVTIDNISVTASKSTDAFPGNNYSINYTEQQASPPAIASTPLITDVDSTLFFSAKAVIRDAVNGDRLNVGTLPSGIVATGNGTGTVVLTSALGASHSAFEMALAALTFSNPGDNPTAADRHIDVTVNDGFRDSAVATTTVHVTPVDDPTTATAQDSIITNYGTANNATFTVADWMLTANDTDPDGAAISNVGTNVGLATLSHSSNSQSVSIRDNSPNGGSFTYSVSNAGPGVGNTTVTLIQDTVGSLDGSNSADIIIGNDSNTTIIGNGGNDIIDAGGGNDIIDAGAGDDKIVWNANNANGNSNNGADGRDIVDGSTNGSTTGDTFTVNGSNSDEVYTIFTAADWLALGGGAGGTGHLLQNNASEIIITRGASPNNGSVIAELRNVEEIVINTGGGNDTVNVSGNFDITHLNYNTIHINDADGSDTVDISALTSEHRIVFSTDTNGHVVGDLRPQDIVDHTAGLAPAGDPGTTVPPQTNGGSDNSNPDNGDDTSEDADDGSAGGTPVTATGGPQIGTADDDLIMASGNAAVVSGLGGDDLIIGAAGDDTIKAGAGDDLVKAGDGDDVVFGNSGDDDIFGGAGHDLLLGDAGDDRIFGDAGDDVLEGGAGKDVVYAGIGDDHVLATSGDDDDVYWGDDGNDTLDYATITADITANLGSGSLSHGSVGSTQSGQDTVFGFENFIGGSGNDAIVASDAVNILEGGAGHDTFVFGSAAAANGDVIRDFQPGDTIDLSGIDANTNTSGNQSFVLFAGNSFTAAGQIIVTHETRDGVDHTMVAGNTNGDTAADFTIDLVGNHTIAPADLHGVN